jgi:two-component system, OmpR family, response regulator
MLITASIIVVEDDPSLRGDLVDYLNLRGFSAAGASTARHLSELLAVRRPVLVLLDIGLPDQSGMDLLPWLRKEHPEIGIIMLTAYGDAHTRVTSLESGADAYLVKGASLEVIEATCLALIRRLHLSFSPHNEPASGQASPAAAAQNDASAWVLELGHGVLRAPQGKSLALTLMEQNFLLQLMRRPTQVVSRQGILAALDRPDTLTNLRNLDGCVARLRRKVEQELGISLPVRSSYGQGYAFTGRALIEQ